MRKISTARILFTDYLCFFLTLVSVLTLPLTVGVIFVWIFTLPWLFRRCKLVKRIVTTGEVVTGILTERSFGKHWCVVRYRYDVAGKTYTTRNYVRRYTLKFQAGDTIEVAYDPKKPELAFPLSIYL